VSDILFSHLAVTSPFPICSVKWNETDRSHSSLCLPVAGYDRKKGNRIACMLVARTHF